MNHNKRPSRWKQVNPVRVIIGYSIGMLMVLAGIYLSTLTPIGPQPAALPYLESNDRIQVSPGSYTFFAPTRESAHIGFIFYPGGRVDYRSYAPLAARLAEKGWPVAVVSMPLNLAVFGPDRAAEVIKDHPEIDRWVIGGHSLGGTMAAQYAIKHADNISGVVFLASYPSDTSLINSNLAVLSIYGSEDGLITLPDWQKYHDRFPMDTQWAFIKGGNHAGFGWYDGQEGDNPALISLERQTEQISEAIDRFLFSIETI